MSIAWDKDFMTLVISLIVMLIFLSVFNSMYNVDTTMVGKIIRGDLPPCNSTVGTNSGYYCQINNISYFCKVDTMAGDPYVKQTPFCAQVYFT